MDQAAQPRTIQAPHRGFLAFVSRASCDDDKKDNKGQWHVRLALAKKNDDDCPGFVVVLYSLKTRLRFVLAEILAAKITFIGVFPQMGFMLGKIVWKSIGRQRRQSKNNICRRSLFPDAKITFSGVKHNNYRRNDRER